ncbi:RND family transporter [Zavarzinia sp.]|uniref:efflux RND transporter permease subunit n=1 Tax=Zavarzinia sp. TaxID=2027920 RepID=UPI0035698A54
MSKLHHAHAAPATFGQRVVEGCSNLLLRFRFVVLALAVGITGVLGYEARNIQLDPGFAKLIPIHHPFMKAFAEYAFIFPGHNRVVLNLHWKGQGDMYNKEFMTAMEALHNEAFFLPNVDRTRVISLFSPSVRYTKVTEEGFIGAPIIPETFTKTDDQLAQVRRNVEDAGIIGRFVGNDAHDAMIMFEIQENVGGERVRVNYYELAHKLDEIRAKYENANIEVNIIGFVMIVGSIVDGLLGVIAFFGISFLITAVLLFLYCRSWKLTGLSLVVALLPVIWLGGLLPLVGAGIDPISILVPFLIFSIGVSHAVQMTNAWKQSVIGGARPVEASRRAFQALFVPGALALITNGLGFLVIMRIEIDIVRELGMTASMGVMLMIVTNKLILPVLLSLINLEKSARKVKHSGDDSVEIRKSWWALSKLATQRPALAVFAVAAVLAGFSAIQARNLKTGDVGQGAPELWPSDRYNVDNAAILSRYDIGTDVLTVIVETTGFSEACLDHSVMAAVDRFDLYARGISGVQSVLTVPAISKLVIAGMNEGNPRWAGLPRSSSGLSVGGYAFNPDLGFNTEGCKAMKVDIFLKNHDGALVAHVIKDIQAYLATENTPNVAFRLASGNVGVTAATNQAVEEAELEMLLSIFGAISLLCFLTFRSFEAVICIIVPLTIVSIFCNALMARLGIGLKVSTLPVIALGVGVGVDYGIYIYERLIHEMRHSGRNLRDAFYEAMRQRGTAALFTAITMSVGVLTWAFSALKFQADMGILLAFMFLVNVFGAIFLLPALAAWLLPAKGFARKPAAEPAASEGVVVSGR